MTGLFLLYNKVHDDSLMVLEPKIKKEFRILWGDLSKFGNNKDLLPYDDVKNFIESFGPLDFVITGDVFWDTGQNICKWGAITKTPIFFLQHGQWIYIKNKKKLPCYPSHTMLFGEDIENMCSMWPYGQHSKCTSVGSPRYDGVRKADGSYIYMCPPVIEEMVHDKPNGFIRKHFLESLKAIRGIDGEARIVIQPHYRESRIDWLQDMFPRAQFADTSLHPFKLICGSSKVIASRNSTVVLDAIAHRKPVVLTDLRKNDVCFFKRDYFGKFALESEDRKSFFDNVLNEIPENNGSNYVDRAKRYIVLGDASDRIVNFIKKEV